MTKSQENWEEFERRVWLVICTIVRYHKYTCECGHGEMRNKYLRNWRSDITQGWGVLQSFNIAFEREWKKKLLQHVVFVVGHPSWMTGQHFFQALLLCGSRKYPYPHQRRSSKIPRGWGISIAGLLKGKYEAKLEIQGGGGRCFKSNNPPWWRNGYFL